MSCEDEPAGHRRADCLRPVRAGGEGFRRGRRLCARPVRGRNKPASQKDANRAHARLRRRVERTKPVAFFTELGMELEGKGQVEGLWADRTVGLPGVRSEIAMMRTLDGHGKLELTRYHAPAADGAGPENPPNTVGLHRVMFAVDDIDNTVARLRAHGAELLGEVAQYESIFLLCYLRGPAGIIVAPAEQIG